MAVVAIILQYKIHAPMVKLMFSQEATKIDESFIVDLTLVINVKSVVKLSIFVVFLENMNFTHL